MSNSLASLRRPVLLASAALAAMAFAVGSANAGQCPAGKQMADATKPVDTAAKGVTDTVLASINLADEPAMVQDRTFRLRRLVIEPGGVVPWHSHGDRPAIIYIVSGEVTEYASNCAVPIVHKAGEVAPETHLTSHWWKNTGKKTATLISADLLKDPGDHMM
jgi:quercetin dioxygenase-like cupin family protein